MPFSTSLSDLAIQIKQKVVQKVIDKKLEIQYWSQTLARSQYADYAKQPVATGDSLAQTTSEVTADMSTLAANLKYIVGKDDLTRARTWATGHVDDYAIFFMDPQSPRNPNFKYGARNPLKDSYEKHMKSLLSQIINS